MTKDNVKKVVSIDFDYWIPEDLVLDLGHQENSLFITTLWNMRLSTYASLETKLCISPDEVPQPMSMGKFFRDRKMKINRSSSPIAAAESHASIVHFLEGMEKVDIFTIDAHHDFGYGDKDKDDCGSWVRTLANADVLNSVHLFYPMWRKKYDYDWNELAQKQADEWKSQGIDVNVSFGLDDFPEGLHVDKLFVCRSGAWSPPWTDDDFIMMFSCLMMNLKMSNYTAYTYNRLDEFRRHIDWGAVREGREATRQFMENAKH